MSDELLYRPERAASLIGVGRATLYELMASGEINSVKIGRSRRIPREALQEYVQRLTDSTSRPAA